jgi:hypothetical protein
MRIGEVAAIADITTRAVRYHHRLGLLPEPERRLTGYREYGMREAAELVPCAGWSSSAQCRPGDHASHPFCSSA